MDSRTVCLCSAAFRRICSRMISAFSLSTRARALDSASMRSSSFLCLSSISCSIVAVTTRSAMSTWSSVQDPAVSVTVVRCVPFLMASCFCTDSSCLRRFSSFRTCWKKTNKQKIKVCTASNFKSTQSICGRRAHLLPELVLVTLSGQLVLILSSL